MAVMYALIPKGNPDNPEVRKRQSEKQAAFSKKHGRQISKARLQF
jgi:hypothetical protein